MANTGTFPAATVVTQFKVSIFGNPQPTDQVYRDEREAAAAVRRLHNESGKAAVAVYDAGGQYVYLFFDGVTRRGVQFASWVLDELIRPAFPAYPRLSVMQLSAAGTAAAPPASRAGYR